MKQKHKGNEPVGKTLDVYFKKSLNQPYPGRIHSHSATRENFIKYPLHPCPYSKIQDGTNGYRNLLDASIVGHRRSDPLMRAAWYMDMRAHSPEVSNLSTVICMHSNGMRGGDDDLPW